MSEIAVEHSAVVHHNPDVGEMLAHDRAATSTGIWSGKFFMWLFLCQDALAFFGLFAAYISVRIGAGALWPAPGVSHPAAGIEPNPLNINLTAINTFILICSSVTMVQSLKSITDGDKKGMTRWLAATALGGAIFMSIQFFEYNKLIHHEHLGMPHSLFDATFFILTGFHGMHVLAGVVYLSALNAAANFRSSTKKMLSDVIVFFISVGLAFALRFCIHSFFGLDMVACSIVGTLYGTMLLGTFMGMKWLMKSGDIPRLIEVAGLYWHFVDLIWIILFTLVYLI